MSATPATSMPSADLDFAGTESSQDLHGALNQLDRIILSFRGESYLAGVRPAPAPSESGEEVEVHYFVRTAEGERVPRSLRVNEAFLPLGWDQELGRFVKIVSGRHHLFLTLPVREGGRLLRTEEGEGTYATYPMVLGADQRAREVASMVEVLSSIHQEARREIALDAAPSAPATSPAGATVFVGDEDFRFFEAVQRAPRDKPCFLISARSSQALQSWWGLGNVRFLGFPQTDDPAVRDAGIRSLRGAVQTLLEISGGGTVAIADLTVLRYPPQVIQGCLDSIRRAVEKRGGQLLVHMDTGLFGELAPLAELPGFEVCIEGAVHPTADPAEP